jgi:chorismate dehydratase
VSKPVPRIGCVPYLNARPLLHGIGHPVAELVPSQLFELYRRGELDVALLSSIDVLSLDEPQAVDGVSISSQGNVYSVILRYEGELSKMTSVLLDPASHTSNVLVRIILGEFHGLNVDYVQSESNDTQFQARLLIGDRAIEERKRTSNRSVSYLDLGGEWYRCTGLPFVYALWAFANDFTDKKYLAETLRSSFLQGKACIADYACNSNDPEFVSRYLGGFIRYDLGENEKKGLSLFSNYLKSYQILPREHPAPCWF